jgi:hypothetical protein
MKKLSSYIERHLFLITCLATLAGIGLTVYLYGFSGETL